MPGFLEIGTARSPGQRHEGDRRDQQDDVHDHRQQTFARIAARTEGKAEDPHHQTLQKAQGGENGQRQRRRQGEKNSRPRIARKRRGGCEDGEHHVDPAGQLHGAVEEASLIDHILRHQPDLWPSTLAGVMRHQDLGQSGKADRTDQDDREGENVGRADTEGEKLRAGLDENRQREQKAERGGIEPAASAIARTQGQRRRPVVMAGKDLRAEPPRHKERRPHGGQRIEKPLAMRAEHRRSDQRGDQQHQADHRHEDLAERHEHRRDH